MELQEINTKEIEKREKIYSALPHEKAREILVTKLQTEFGYIVDKAIKQAKDGDSEARRWLTDRAWGKAKESIDMNVRPVFSLKALSESADRMEREDKMPPPIPLEQLI
ncbi:MAG: hypothetical protein WDK96_00065 [Candidatus Paceibacterota bacterium]|jgi:hypothetical protein